VQHPQFVDRGGWNPSLLNWAVLAAIVGSVAALWRHRLHAFALYVALLAGLTFLNQGTITLGKHISDCPPFFLGLALLLGVRGSQRYAPLAAGLLALVAFCNGGGLFFTMF